MHCVREVTENIYWIGANDRRLSLFENIHPIPNGVSYNSYILLDEKTVLFDTVDWSVCRQFLENIDYITKGKKIDYIVINHVEPDHAASLQEILIRFPEIKIISTPKAFSFIKQFGFSLNSHECIQIKEGDEMSFGKHTVKFITAPMVHWPEAMVTFDTTSGVLFSADAFGSFGALNGKLFNDEINVDTDWLDEGRRYYTNIVGKYGPQVQALLKKASSIVDKIKFICPLHGQVWRSNFEYLINKYNLWSTYEPEEKGVLIVYASMYGNTESVVDSLVNELTKKGITNTAVYDVSSTHVSQLISESFKYSHIILASVTYNMGIYPTMHNFIVDMKALNLQKRTFGIIENGTWAASSGNLIQKFVENELKDCKVIEKRFSINSSAQNDRFDELLELSEIIAKA